MAETTQELRMASNSMKVGGASSYVAHAWQQWCSSICMMQDM